MLVAAMLNHGGATETKDSPWENITPKPGKRPSALLLSSHQTCPSTGQCASSSGHLDISSANGVCQIQGRPDIPCGIQQSTADFGRLGQPIRNDCRSARQVPPPPTISTPPMMLVTDSEYAPYDIGDVLVPTTAEPLDIDQDHGYDMITEERPLTPPLQFDTPTDLTQSNHENFVFQIMCRNTRNLVLDSTHPDIMPHIVITPPDNYWDAYAVLSHNRVDVQYTAYLTVPQCDASKWARMPPSDSRLQQSEAVGDAHDRHELPPKAVFSPSKFAHSVECSANERLIMYHVTSALQKLQCKTVAHTASEAAKQFRHRYDCPEFLQSLEKPFKWTDPAEPLLKCGSLPGNTVLDSISPLFVPHVIITEPLPEDPWIAWANATNDPQDAGFGTYLTVPSRHVSFINHNPHDCDVNFDGDGGGSAEAPDLSECESRPDTPLPGTPMLGSYDDSDDAIIICCPFDDESYPDMDPRESACEELPERPSCNIFAHHEDEDEDGPPPFDDWYLRILERTSGFVIP